MEDTQQDVTPAEETAPDSSPVDQTTTTDAVETAPVEDKAQTVPYERFREVNEQAKRAQELEKRLADLEARQQPQPEVNSEEEAVKEYVKSLGFVSAEEAEAKFQATLREREAETQLRQEVTDLSRRYDGKNGLPKFDKDAVLDYAKQNNMFGPLEQTYKVMHEKAWIDWNVQQAIQKSKGVQSEGSDGSGSAQVGTTNDDLRSAAMRGDKNALNTFIKRLQSK